MKNILKSLTVLVFFSLIFLTFSYPALAFTIRTGQSITIPSGEVIDEVLMATGNDIFIDGIVNSDVFCAGRRVEINGTVTGDVICAGQNITVNGTVGGNVRIAGQNVTLKGNIAKNVIIFGQTLTNEAVIEGEMLVGGQDATINGQIGKNLMAFAQSVKLDTPIGGNVDLTAENLYLGSKAAVKGNLNYMSNKKLTMAPEALVSGKTTQKMVPKEKEKEKLKTAWWPKVRTQITMTKKESWLLGLLKSVLVNLGIGLILVFFFKDRLTKTVDYIITSGNRARSMGVGLLVLLLTPAVIIVFVITLIGIPVAILLAVAYGLTICVSRIVTAMAVGRRLTGEYWKSQKDSLMAAVLLGVVVCWIVFAIPWIGKLFSFIAILWGLGGVYYFIRPEVKK